MRKGVAEILGGCIIRAQARRILMMNMDRNELLTLIGLIIGVPGFLLLFFQGQAVIGVVVFGVCIGLAWLYWFLNQPEFTLLEVRRVIRLLDRDGTRAQMERYQEARANHKGLSEFCHKGIMADGSIENIRIDGDEPDYQALECGAIVVCKYFPDTLERGEKLEMTLTYDLVNSFTKKSEAIIHVISHKTKRLTLEVQCPSDRPVRDVKASLRYGGQKFKLLPKPKRSPDSCQIVLEIKRPKLGEEYYLEWDW